MVSARFCEIYFTLQVLLYTFKGSMTHFARTPDLHEISSAGAWLLTFEEYCGSLRTQNVSVEEKKV